MSNESELYYSYYKSPKIVIVPTETSTIVKWIKDPDTATNTLSTENVREAYVGKVLPETPAPQRACLDNNVVDGPINVGNIANNTKSRYDISPSPAIPRADVNIIGNEFITPKNYSYQSRNLVVLTGDCKHEVILARSTKLASNLNENEIIDLSIKEDPITVEEKNHNSNIKQVQVSVPTYQPLIHAQDIIEPSILSIRLPPTPLEETSTTRQHQEPITSIQQPLPQLKTTIESSISFIQQPLINVTDTTASTNRPVDEIDSAKYAAIEKYLAYIDNTYEDTLNYKIKNETKNDKDSKTEKKLKELQRPKREKRRDASSLEQKINKGISNKKNKCNFDQKTKLNKKESKKRFSQIKENNERINEKVPEKLERKKRKEEITKKITHYAVLNKERQKAKEKLLRSLEVKKYKEKSNEKLALYLQLKKKRESIDKLIRKMEEKYSATKPNYKTIKSPTSFFSDVTKVNSKQMQPDPKKVQKISSNTSKFEGNRIQKESMIEKKRDFNRNKQLTVPKKSLIRSSKNETKNIKSIIKIANTNEKTNKYNRPINFYNEVDLRTILTHRRTKSHTHISHREANKNENNTPPRENLVITLNQDLSGISKSESDLYTKTVKVAHKGLPKMKCIESKAKVKKPKKIKLVINIEYLNSNSTQTKIHSDSDESDESASFLDDFNVDEIIDSLNVCDSSINISNNSPQDSLSNVCGNVQPVSEVLLQELNMKKEELREGTGQELKAKQKYDMLTDLQRCAKKTNNTSSFIDILSSFTLPGECCFLTEFYPKTLEQALQENKKCFHIDLVQTLARQLVNAVCMLTDNFIVHTDIKPTHILMNSTNDRLKLCGFDRAEYAYNLRNVILPYAGSVNYRAPEIILGFDTDYSKIDEWSIALVIFEMATGTKLFPGKFNNDILFKQQCTLGRIDDDMLKNSIHQSVHFSGSEFKRLIGPGSWVLTRFYSRNNKLRHSLVHSYNMDWRASRQQQCLKDLDKIEMLNTMIEHMLKMNPLKRIPIQYVASSFFFVFECRL